MKFYADTTARRTRQLLGDIAVLVWVAIWVWVGRQVHDTVSSLRVPADRLAGAGTSVHDSLAGAGDQAGRIPVVGDGLRDWLDQAARSGQDLHDAGTSLATTIDRVALWLGWSIALVPVVLVVGTWLWMRVRFVRRATATQRYIDSADDLDLFALRAMVEQPVSALARISADPAGAWRRRDPELIRSLAALELHQEGLRLPARWQTGVRPGA